MDHDSARSLTKTHLNWLFTHAAIIKKLVISHLMSYLIFAVIEYTSLLSTKHVGKNKDITVFLILDT